MVACRLSQRHRDRSFSQVGRPTFVRSFSHSFSFGCCPRSEMVFALLWHHIKWLSKVSYQRQDLDTDFRHPKFCCKQKSAGSPLFRRCARSEMYFILIAIKSILFRIPKTCFDFDFRHLKFWCQGITYVAARSDSAGRLR